MRRVFKFSFRIIVNLIKLFNVFNRALIRTLVIIDFNINLLSGNLSRFIAPHYELSNLSVPKLSILHQIIMGSKLKKVPYPRHVKALKEPTFGVAITTFNQDPTEIKRALDSCLNQTDKFDSIKVIDGGSTNKNTLGYLERLKNEFEETITIDMRSTESVISSRNSFGLSSESDYIVFLDPDDWLKLDFLRNVKMAQSINPTADIIYTDVEVRNPGGSMQIWHTGPFEFNALLKHNRIPITSVIKKCFFNQIGGFNAEVEKGPEDWDLWLRSATLGARAVHIPLCLFVNTGVKPNGRTEFNQEHVEIERLKVQRRALELLNARKTSKLMVINKP